MPDRTFFITTPIYYVNDLPHIGHIYTTVVADVIARYRRMCGFDVRFLTGTDEHGQKIERSARAQGITPKELADRVVGRYHQLWKSLNITHDDFIRTTEARHREGVHALIALLQARGDIYKGAYEGWYCAGCEAFYPETQLVNGACPDQGHAVEMVKEESYFFRLSAYQQPLLEYYAAHPELIRPASRFNEVVRFVEGGLKDLSISRASLQWGIPWPGDPGHVVYVWLDALTNYISALGFGSRDQSLYDHFWPAGLHLVGKDILRFHCVYWPAFLMSAGLPLPKQVFGHGWWMKDERKMSKSLGNVVRPDALLDRFGADPLRYFLLREMNFGLDSGFSDEGFLARYNADLANGLGNASARVLAMARRYFAGRTPSGPSSDNVLAVKAAEVTARYTAAMGGYEFQRALEAVWELLSAVDGFVNETAPWSIAKREGNDSPLLQRTIYAALEALRIVAVMVSPVMPTVATRLLGQLGVPGGRCGEDDLNWSGLPAGVPLGEDGALFPRIDIEAYFQEVNMNDQSDSASTATAAVAPAEVVVNRAAQVPAGLSTASTDATAGESSPGVAGVPAGAKDGAAAEQIDIDTFFRAKLVIGQIRAADRVPKSSKLIRMDVDLGEATLRQIVAGIGTVYEPEQLLGRRAVFVANLKPAKLMGVESQGMILAATLDGKPVLLGVEGEVPPGTGVK